MMSLPSLSEAQIQQHASEESFARGASYYHNGAVGELVLRSGQLQAARSTGAPSTCSAMPPSASRLSPVAVTTMSASSTSPEETCTPFIIRLKRLREPFGALLKVFAWRR